MLGVMAALALRVSGVNAMTMYSQPIVNAALSNHMSVSDTETAKYIVCGVNVVRLLMTSFSVRLVDRIGRRRYYSHLSHSNFYTTLILKLLLSNGMQLENSSLGLMSN